MYPSLGLISEPPSVPDDNDEERLVVNELASIIRQEQEKLREYTDHFKTDEELPDEAEEAAPVQAPVAKSPSFTYQEPKPVRPDDVPRLSKQPFAVPPSDFRFFQPGRYIYMGLRSTPQLPLRLTRLRIAGCQV